MIKIKILNPTQGRNEPTFRPLFFVKDMLQDYSIDITESDDYDFLFIGMDDFLDKKISLNESINYGLENLSKITGDYFLFDGSDSTSLMGAYEVFEQSNAIYLFKNQKFKTKEEYKSPSAFNKYFWGSGSKLDLSYNIPKDTWGKIKFSGINLGYWIPQYHNIQPICNNKEIDICAIFQAKHDYSEDHKVRNDTFYTEHRKGLWDKLDPLKPKYNMLTKRMPYQEYIKSLWGSKLTLSPFGMGELCFRDFEGMQLGTIILKPDQSKVDSLPNMMIENETYIPCKYDWSDLEEKIDYILTNLKELNERLNFNIRKIFQEQYTHENLCLHWYNIFNNLNDIESC